MPDSTKNVLYTRIAQRIDTESAWQSANPKLYKGELAITYVGPWEDDSGNKHVSKFKFKIGDGVHLWSELPYTYDLDEIEGKTNAKIAGLEDDINDVIEGLGGNVYERTSIADLNNVKGKKGDIGIVKTEINAAGNGIDAHYSYTGYAWDTNAKSGAGAWAAFDGNYDASNVYFNDDLLSTTKVGYIDASTDGSKNIPAKGKNLTELFEAMYVKEETTGLADTNTIKINIATTKQTIEIGTEKAISYTTSFTPGSYKYGPSPTGVAADSYSITNTWDVNDVKTEASGSFNNFKFANTGTFKITARVNYTAGKDAKSNKGREIPGSGFAAGSKTSSAVDAVVVYAPNFIGHTTTKVLKEFTKDTVTEEFIRGNCSNLGSATNVLPSYGAGNNWKQFFYALPASRKTSMAVADGPLPFTVTKIDSVKFNFNGVEVYYNIFCIDSTSAINNAVTIK